jgi:fluoride exporter
MQLKEIVLVGIGGMTGSVMRYLAGYFIRQDIFPYATLTVNLAGSFLMGVIMGFAAKQQGFDNWRLFLATGICGGFTTFSAFAWENMQLLVQQRLGSFVLYRTCHCNGGLLDY